MAERESRGAPSPEELLAKYTVVPHEYRPIPTTQPLTEDDSYWYLSLTIAVSSGASENTNNTKYRYLIDTGDSGYILPDPVYSALQSKMEQVLGPKITNRCFKSSSTDPSDLIFPCPTPAQMARLSLSATALAYADPFGNLSDALALTIHSSSLFDTFGGFCSCANARILLGTAGRYVLGAQALRGAGRTIFFKGTPRTAMYEKADGGTATFDET